MNDNGHLSITFLTSPPNSTLRLLGYTTNAPAVINLHAAYEGQFLGYTSEGENATLVVNETAEDPSGLGRSRVVNYKEDVRRMVYGDVRWVNDGDGDGENEEPERGQVHIWTSNAPVLLSL